MSQSFPSMAVATVRDSLWPLPTPLKTVAITIHNYKSHDDFHFIVRRRHCYFCAIDIVHPFALTKLR